MADRRPEDAAPAAPASPAADDSTPRDPAPADSGAGRSGRRGTSPTEQQELSERINAAYKSSEPVVSDEPPQGGSRGGQKAGSSKAASGEAGPTGAAPAGTQEVGTERRRPTGAERFAAALAATTGGGAGGRTAVRAQRAPSGQQPQAGHQGQYSRPRPTTTRKVRRARLRLTHVDPWSVMKTSFLLSVAIGIVTVVAVAVVWAVIGAAGVWESIDSAVGDVLGQSSLGFTIQDYVGMSRVMGFTLIVAVVDVVLITVIATLAAFLYNLAAALLGGIEVVLAEDDH